MGLDESLILVLPGWKTAVLSEVVLTLPHHSLYSLPP